MGTSVSTRFQIAGMDCAGCAAKIDKAVRRMPGVEEVAVSAIAGTMTVRHSAATDIEAIEENVTGLGYRISSAAGAEQSWGP